MQVWLAHVINCICLPLRNVNSCAQNLFNTHSITFVSIVCFDRSREFRIRNSTASSWCRRKTWKIKAKIQEPLNADSGMARPRRLQSVSAPMGSTVATVTVISTVGIYTQGLSNHAIDQSIFLFSLRVAMCVCVRMGECVWCVFHNAFCNIVSLG